MKRVTRLVVPISFLFASLSAVGQMVTDIRWAGISDAEWARVAAIQVGDQLCWAASIQMILNWHGIPASQQEVVARLRGIPVNTSGSDADINAALNTWGTAADGQTRTIRSVTGPGWPAHQILVDQLSRKQPILIGFSSGPYSKHAVVITGVTFTPTLNGPAIGKVVIRDPFPTPFFAQTLGKTELEGDQLKAFEQNVRAYWLVSVRSSPF